MSDLVSQFVQATKASLYLAEQYLLRNNNNLRDAIADYQRSDFTLLLSRPKPKPYVLYKSSPWRLSYKSSPWRLPSNEPEY